MLSGVFARYFIRLMSPSFSSNGEGNRQEFVLPSVGQHSAGLGKTKTAVIWTGGTIGSVATLNDKQEEVSRPGMTGKDFQKLLDVGFLARNEFAWVPVMEDKPRGLDSTEMTNEIMMLIVRKIHEVLANPAYKDHRIVVTHGTDSLEHTATYASLALQGLDRAVVFTGSQIRPGASQSDALSNFDLAVKAAGINTKQVLVAFGSKVMRGNAATKQDGIATGSTFGSPHQDLVAELMGSELRVMNPDMLRVPEGHGPGLKYIPGLQGDVKCERFAPNLNNEVALRKVLDTDYDAVIFEGYAAGNMPTSIAHVIREMSERMMIIITPSTATHGVKETLYEGSPSISHQTATHFIGSPHVALTKFQWLYSQGRKLGLRNTSESRALLRWIKERFSISYAGEGSRNNDIPDFPADLLLKTEKSISELRKEAIPFTLHIPRNKPLTISEAADLKRSNQSAIEMSIWHAKLHEKADQLIEEGSLSEERKSEWMEQRIRVRPPLHWLVEHAEPDQGIIWAYFHSPLIFDEKILPMCGNGGEYIFHPLMCSMLGFDPPAEGEMRVSVQDGLEKRESTGQSPDMNPNFLSLLRSELPLGSSGTEAAQ